MPSLAGDRWRWNRRRGAAGQPAPLVPSPPNGRGRWYVSNPAMRHRPPRLPPLPRLSPPPRSPSHGPPLRPPHLGWGHPPRRHGGLPVRSPRPSAGSQGSDWGHRSGVTFCSAAASPATTPTTAPPPRSCARRRRPPGRDLPRRDRSAGPAADRASRASPRRGKRVPRLRRREGQRASLEGRLARRRGDAEGGGTGKTASPATRPTTVHAGKAGHTRRDEETEGGRRWIGVRLRFFHESPPTHRRRGAHTKARRDGDTKRRRRGLDWGQASFLSREPARPPPARGAHEGTKARRDGGGRRWGALRVKPPIHRRRGRTRRHEGTKRRRHEETEGGDSPRRCCLHESPPIHHRRGTHTNRKTSGSGLETSGVEARCLASRGQGGVDRRDHRAMVDPGVVTQSPPSRRERPPVRGNSYWPSP